MNKKMGLTIGGIVLAVIVVVVVIFTAVHSRKYGPHIKVQWRDTKSAITVKMPVRYSGTEANGQKMPVSVGEVTKLLMSDGREVEIGLYRKMAHYVTTKTTFLFREAMGDQAGYIEAVVLDSAAPPVQDGAVLQGSESDLEAKVRGWTTDWQRTLIWLGIGIGLLLVFLLIVKLIFHLWALLVCIAGGVAGAIYFRPVIEAAIIPYVPQGVRPDFVAYGAAFLGGYLACMVLLALLRAPLRINKGSQG
mgnify:CR=1 FL=1